MKAKRRFGKLSAFLLAVVIFMTFIPSLALGETNSIQSETEVSYQTQEGAEWEDGTFAEALANVYDGGTIKLLKDIELTDTVTVEKKVTITSNDKSSLKKIIAVTDQHGYMICVKNEVTMENVIIDGGGENDITASEAMIAVGSLIKSGKLTLGEGAILCNNNNTRERGAGGAVCVIFGDLIVSGGQITSNTAFAGAAIAVVTNNANAAINNGSVVSDNTATDSGYSGGGTIFISAGTFIMTGGEIKNNNSVNCGGAIFINKENADAEAVCKIQGGTITANTANYGAGIYSTSSSSIEFSGGSLTGNTAVNDGGGIYAPPDNNIAISGTVVVDGNTASRNGANVYLLYSPAVTVGQLNDTAKVDIFTSEKPETGNTLLIAEPTEGYTLTDNDISKLSYEDTNFSFKLINGNVVLTAVCTVSFNANGGSVTDESMETVGGKLESLPTPTRNGYTFNGWFDAQTGGNKITTDTVFDTDTTVYAQWTKQSSGGSISSAPATYTVKFETNGGSEIDSVKVTRNKTVNEPAAPTKDGFTFEGWYTDKELTTVYDFETKVTKNFTLYAKWTEVKTEEPDDKPGVSDTECDGTIADNCPSLAFDDLDTTQWYHLDTDYVIENDLFKGTTKTTFAPNDKLTRAMLITVLYRAEGEPEVTGEATFEDIDSNAYYAEAVSWGQQNGIIKGYSKTEFAPDQNIIREQIAAIMHRYAQYKGYDVSVGENTNILSYDDYSNISEYAIPSVQYAVGAGLMKGKTTSTINPSDSATRAEIAAILHRFIKATNK